MKWFIIIFGFFFLSLCSSDKEYKEMSSQKVYKPDVVTVYKSENDKRALEDQGLRPLVLWPFLKKEVAYIKLSCNLLSQDGLPTSEVFFFSPETRYIASEVTGEMIAYVKPKLKIVPIWFHEGQAFRESSSPFSDTPILIESIGLFAHIGQKTSDNQKITYSYLQKLAKESCLNIR